MVHDDRRVTFGVDGAGDAQPVGEPGVDPGAGGGQLRPQGRVDAGLDEDRVPGQGQCPLRAGRVLREHGQRPGQLLRRDGAHPRRDVLPVGALPGGEPLHDRVEQGIPGTEVVGGRAGRQPGGSVHGAMGERMDTALAEHVDRGIEQVITPVHHAA